MAALVLGTAGGTRIGSFAAIVLTRAQRNAHDEMKLPPHMSDELRWIWVFGPNPEGPYSEADLRTMIRRHVITPENLYWSEHLQQWRPIRGLHCEDHDEHLAQMRRSGVKRVGFADSGHGEDCRICSELADKRFTILDAPSLPPHGCECEPWCGAKMIAL